MSRPIGKLERLAYERHERDLRLAARKSGHPKGFVFDAPAADRIVEFVEGFCCHYKGEWAGQPLLLEDVERFCARSIFGWKRGDGTRRFRKAWIEVAKKNFKTTFAASVGLYLLVADQEPGGEVYVTATKKEQAGICHRAARAMVKASPGLSRFVSVPRAELGPLVCERLASTMKILSSDYGTQDGWNISGDIRDEVHEWAAPELAAKLEGGSAARRQPLTLEITTAGVYDPEGVGWKRHKYCVDLLEGTIEDDQQFALIAAIDDGDDWRDLECRAAGAGHTHEACVIRKANPNLGESPKIDFIDGELNRALQDPGKVNDFQRYHLNHWTQQATRWLNLERWKESESAALTEAELVGLPCVGGLDFADKIDLCALVLAFDREDGWLDFLCRFWLPEERIAFEAKRQRQFFAEWATAGWLRATPGAVIDHGLIRREVNELRDAGYAIGSFGYDPARATQVATQLREEDGFAMVEVRQGTMTLHEPSKYLEAKIIQRRARATGPPGGPNPIARWMVGNATKRTDANMGIAPDKKRSKDKIDFVSAAVTALSQVVAGEEGQHIGELVIVGGEEPAAEEAFAPSSFVTPPPEASEVAIERPDLLSGLDDDD